MSMISTPPSLVLATRAKVDESIFTVAISDGSFKFV